MKIAIGQINSTIGDFDGNRDQIITAVHTARDAGAHLIGFPELCLCGYPPMDLLDHTTFVEENLYSLRQLQRELPPDIAAIVGYVDRTPHTAGKSLQNTAAVLFDRSIPFRQAKRLLPTYDVFDEARYFEPARESRVWEYRGLRIGLAICEDIWWETEPVPGTRYPVDPVRDLVDAGADVIVAPSASPFYRGKPAIRRSLVSSIGRNSGVPVVYVNAVGANDNLIFDGASLITDATGTIRREGAHFEPDLMVYDLVTRAGPAGGTDPAGDSTPTPVPTPIEDPQARGDSDGLADLEAALVLGIRDYLRKTGFSRVHLGLSGGIDSALVAVLAVRALGPERVTGFLMPSEYSSAGSITDAEELAQNLGIACFTLPITGIYQAFSEALREQFAGTEPGVAEENIQARTRGNLLMAWSNKFGSLTLTTGNKSELAVGYCTLYGDMSGALAVIGDVLKTEVFALARYINRDGEIIPEATIAKPPSAELRPDQRDDDSLPPYPVLDRILTAYLLESRTYSQIIAEGQDPDTVALVLGLVGRSEYKRRQAPPVLKVSARAFGTGRRMPIARHIYERHR